MRQFQLLGILIFSFQMMSQTGIGTTTPNASAKLDVYATNKGFLPPRVTLTSTTDATTITSPAEGLLVYNVGSVGLQAGYYYWNGANWATIATATSAGNGVTAMDMVKLYGEGYSTASNKISNASGYSFTVPISGRYVFDFSSTTWGGNATTTFKVRQGTTDLGTDSQTSLNNNVHVEYNGKVEVNLQSGITYNVALATNANRDSGDYDRVYYKMVAGNLPVTGQSVDYAMASLSAAQTISAVGNVQFNTLQGTGITLNNGGFNLIANKTYKLEGSVGGSSTGYIYYAWVDASNTIISGGSVGGVMKAGGAYSDGPQDKAVAYYTPSSNTTVYLRVLTISGSSTAQPSTTGTPNWTSTWASISQVGSSAFVNPWILSGNDVYNTTGKVGIGTTAPAYSLEVNGTAKLVTAPGITTATSVLVRNPTTSQISEQPISYITGVAKFIRNTNQGTINAGTTVLFNTSSNNTISNYVALNTSTGVITLQPGTYELNGSVGALGASAGSNGDCRIYPVFHNGSAYVGTGGVSETGPAGNWNGMPQNNANYIITVPVGQTAQLTLKAAIVNNVATLSETGDFGAIGDAGRAWVVVRKYN